MKIHDLLKELNACDSAQKWASDKTWEQIYNECHRGDWLCWLFVRTNPDDVRLLTLVKGHQANTVRHLMKDERSLAAVDAAIAFGEGKISVEELKIFYRFATHAVNAAAANASAYVVSAAYAAANASAYAAAYAVGAAAAKKQNQQDTADIFRKFISIDKFNL